MHLIKKAWNKVHKNDVEFLQSFTKAGCGITDNGTDYNCICPQKFEPGEYTIYYSLDASTQVQLDGHSASSPEPKSLDYAIQETAAYSVMEGVQFRGCSIDIDEDEVLE